MDTMQASTSSSSSSSPPRRSTSWFGARQQVVEGSNSTTNGEATQLQEGPAWWNKQKKRLSWRGHNNSRTKPLDDSTSSTISTASCNTVDSSSSIQETLTSPYEQLLLQEAILDSQRGSIKKTFECTTQLAKCHTKVPLQKHWQPRFPFLNVQRLSEPVATDTIFSNAKALGGMYVPKASLGHRVV